MWMRRVALVVVVVAGVAAGVGGGQNRPAIELGPLQAVVSNSPPFIFRLSIFRHGQFPPGNPAVVVRRPGDVPFFIKNNTLELHLPELADVELEIRHTGQTLNRLLLKTELQAARARLQAGMAWERYQGAKSKGLDGARLGRLLEEAHRDHQAWARVDPDGARPPLQRVVRERTRVVEERLGRQDSARDEETPPRAAMVASAALENRMAALEREIGGIREGIHGLIGLTASWADASHRLWTQRQDEQRAVTPILVVTLGGLLVAGVASLLTAYSMQHRAVQRELQRRRVLVAALQTAREALPTAGFGIPAAPLDRPGSMQPGVERQPLTPVVRRVRLSHKTRRRVHLSGPQNAEGPADRIPLERIPPGGQESQSGIPGTSDLHTTLATLRQELMSVQKRYRSQPHQVKQIQALLAQLLEMAKKT